MHPLLFLLAVLTQTHSLPLPFTPGLTIPPICQASPILNECPARLSSNNALLTSTNTVIVSSTGATIQKYPNILYAGYSPQDLTEFSTLVAFDFPAVNGSCRFRLVSDAGDNAGGQPNVYNVWSLIPPLPPPGNFSKYLVNYTEGRPQRDLVLATFLLDEELAETTGNEKFLHKFVFGAQEFPCPGAGRLGYEVASAVRNPGAGGAMNIGGHSGLGIEIIGMPSAWV